MHPIVNSPAPSLYEKLYDASIDCILAFDAQLKLIAWNKSCEEFTSLTKKDVVGQGFYDIFPEAARCKSVPKAIEHAFKGYKSFISNNDTSYFHKNTEHHFIPVKDQEKVTAVMIIIHDVSHRVKAENQLRTLNNILDDRNRQLDKKNIEILSFTQVTGHDLKEPIRKIKLFADLIASRGMINFTEEGVDFFKRIQASIRRMINLADDLITYAEVTPDEKESEVDLNIIIKFARHTIQHKVDHSRARVTLSNRLPTITGYRGMLTLLFKNLMSNAIKFQRENSIPDIVISSTIVKGALTEQKKAAPDTEYVCISVKDNGIGIAPHHHSNYSTCFIKPPRIATAAMASD